MSLAQNDRVCDTVSDRGHDAARGSVHRTHMRPRLIGARWVNALGRCRRLHVRPRLKAQQVLLFRWGGTWRATVGSSVWA